MTQELVDNLRKNFLNKICTLLTSPTSFPFKDAVQHSRFFTGEVVDINVYGLWVKNLEFNTYAFFSFPIVGIIEEQVIPGNDPRAKKVVEDIKKPIPSNFIPVEALTKLVKESK